MPEKLQEKMPSVTAALYMQFLCNCYYILMKLLSCSSCSFGPFTHTSFDGNFVALHFMQACTVAHNCHIKFKFSHQKQIPHIKIKFTTSNTNSPQQKQNRHSKNKFATSKTNLSQQKQIPHIKNISLTSKSKTEIKRSAVNERKLSPVFTRPSPDRHFVLAHASPQFSAVENNCKPVFVFLDIQQKFY